MRLLGAAEIIAVADLPYEDVPTPEWGEDTGVRVYRLTGEEWDEFENSTIAFDGERTRRDNANFRAKMAAIAIKDEKRQRLFTADQVEDLGAKNIATLDRIYDVAIRLCKRRKEDMEELEKNFGPASGAGSSSTSPAISNGHAANCSPALMPLN